MTNLFKLALGLGAAVGAAALALSLSKKAEEEEKVEFENMEDWDDMEDIEDLEKLDGVDYPEDDEADVDDDFCCCENCKSWNGEECVCDDNCGECHEMGEDDKKSSHDIKTAVNSIVDGVMGGIVVAADKVSELTSKLSDFVAEKLDERKEAAAPDFTFEWEEEGDSAVAEKAEDIAEDLAEKAEEAMEDVKDFAEDLADGVMEGIENAADDIQDVID